MLLLPYIEDLNANVIDRLGLLRCNHVVGREAAAIFYQWNTFRVTGYDVWNPFYRVLKTIGNENRSKLRRLIVNIPRPKRLEQDSHGVRKMFEWYMPFERVHSCGHPEIRTLDSEHHYLDPAIEACFRILGKPGSNITLEIVLPAGFVPGAEVWIESQVPDFYCWNSIEILDSIERSRKEFGSRVEVVWKGSGLRHLFLQQKELIQERGWEILEAKEGEISPQAPAHFPQWGPILTVLFVLRRKESAATAASSG